MKLTAVFGLIVGITSLIGIAGVAITRHTTVPLSTMTSPIPIVMASSTNSTEEVAVSDVATVEAYSKIVDDIALISDGSTKTYKKPQSLSLQNSTRDRDGNVYVSVENQVRTYFADTPILIEVARCESQFRQTSTTGAVIQGRVNKSDRGVMQINTYYHLTEAKKLGYDIYTLEGNMAYAKHLYEKEGTQPWISSKPCWGGQSGILAKK